MGSNPRQFSFENGMFGVGGVAVVLFCLFVVLPPWLFKLQVALACPNIHVYYDRLLLCVIHTCNLIDMTENVSLPPYMHYEQDGIHLWGFNSINPIMESQFTFTASTLESRVLMKGMVWMEGSVCNMS